jgi:transcriptional regulator with XRE-family HTH domain
MTIPERLRELIAADGRSLGALADRSGVHRQTLYAWRSGRAIPTPALLSCLLIALGVPADQSDAMLVQAREWQSAYLVRAGRASRRGAP